MTCAKKRSLAFFLMLVSLFGVSLGTVYTVGDSAGWTLLDIDYTNWASTKNFHVGDSLLFEYNNEFHNVVQVSLKDFQSCNGEYAIATYGSGSDSVTLDSPGHYYFLCGVPGHCETGQKVDVFVMPLGPISSPSPAINGSSSTNPESQISSAPGPYQITDPSLLFSKLYSALGIVTFGLLGFVF